ncbi:hypothetical protein OEG84_04280 [Hoeflea sp. G2-23]|uniref:Uncharacterized protein n=1 Tax=Hoeflea algicola TaxID=2983763 RepID=A0ABT3Z5H0_9HYPH|nr:hypothetical protein [Hoeflea algicola]MCY0146954.1 hypothetical protein [Hoeflea algicola]
MTLALALLSLMIVMLFSALVIGAMRQSVPRPAPAPVWSHDRSARR